MNEYGITANRVNGNIYMFAMVDAENGFDALMQASDNSHLKEMIEKGELEPFERWKVENLTEKRHEKRLKENPQLNLFSKGA